MISAVDASDCTGSVCGNGGFCDPDPDDDVGSPGDSWKNDNDYTCQCPCNIGGDDCDGAFY